LHGHFDAALRLAAQRFDVVTPSPCNTCVIGVIKRIGGLTPFRDIQHLIVELVPRRFE
jgi:hypothetical protein